MTAEIVKFRFRRSNLTEDEIFEQENKEAMLENLDTIREAIEEGRVVDIFFIGIGSTSDDDVHCHSMGIGKNPASAIGMLEALKTFIIHGGNLPGVDQDY